MKAYHIILKPKQYGLKVCQINHYLPTTTSIKWKKKNLTTKSKGVVLPASTNQTDIGFI